MKYALVLNAPNLDVEISESLIVAADGGYRLVKDKPVTAVIGDFDTLGYLPDNVKTITYPTDKCQTDGEICLDYLKNIGASEVVIYGATGGRIDHVLGNINLLAYANEIGLKAKIVSSECTIYHISDKFTAEAETGSVLSLIPFGGTVILRSSKGLKYPLKGLIIKPSSSLGISNETTQKNVEIEVESGSAIIVIRKKN